MKKLLLILLLFFLNSCEQYDKKWQIDQALENCADDGWVRMWKKHVSDSKFRDRQLGVVLDPFEIKIQFEGYKHQISYCKDEFIHSENQRRFVKKWFKKNIRKRLYPERYNK